MFSAQVQRRDTIQFNHFPIDTDTHETLCPDPFNLLYMFAFSALNHGRQQHQSTTMGLFSNLIHHLADGLGSKGSLVFRTARFAHPGK